MTDCLPHLGCAGLQGVVNHGLYIYIITFFWGVIQRTVLIRSGLYCPVGVVPGRLAQLIYFTLGRLIAKASKDLMGKQT